MNNILSACISSFSIIVAVILIMYYYLFYGIRGLEGVGWILAVLGAPTTLLEFFVYKLGISKGNIVADLIWITLFYLLQYQLIALFFLNNKNKSRFILFFSIVAIVIISAVMVWNIIFARPVHF